MVPQSPSSIAIWFNGLLQTRIPPYFQSSNLVQFYELAADRVWNLLPRYGVTMPCSANCLLSAKCNPAFRRISLPAVQNAVGQEALCDRPRPFILGRWPNATEMPSINLVREMRADCTVGPARKPIFVLYAADVNQSTIDPSLVAPPHFSSGILARFGYLAPSVLHKRLSSVSYRSLHSGVVRRNAVVPIHSRLRNGVAVVVGQEGCRAPGHDPREARRRMPVEIEIRNT